MSWISLTDEIRAIRFLLDPDATDRSGPYNLTAPNPVTDAELTAALHAALKRPDFRWVRVPESMLRLGLGEMSSELLNNARVLPRRLLAAGFQFEYPTIATALAAALHTGPPVDATPSRSGTRTHRRENTRRGPHRGTSHRTTGALSPRSSSRE